MSGQGILSFGGKSEHAETAFRLSHRSDALKLSQVPNTELLEIRQGQPFGNGRQTLEGVAAAIAIGFRIGQGTDAEPI